MAQFVLDSSQLDQDVLGPVVFASGTAVLGGLTGTATAIVTNVVTATASLGSLTATATQVTPEPEGGGGRNRFDTDRHLINLRRPRPVPQPQVEIQPEIVKVTVVIKGKARSTNKLEAIATSQIQWSILDDDAEILSLI